jgi:cell shape-determining protein MreC
MNRAKLERKRSRKIKRTLCIVLAAVVMLSSTESSLDYLFATYGAESAVYYFFLYIWAVLYAFGYDPNSDEFSKLKIENTLIKEKLETYKNVNEKLKAELENTRNKS